MCLPIGMLKCYSTIGAVVTLVAGLALLGVSIYGFTTSDIWIKEASGNKNLLMLLVIIADALVIITACLAIYGIKKGKPCLLFLFTILVGIFCLVLVGGGIIAQYAPDTMLDDTMCLPSETDPNSWVNTVTALELLSKSFCTSQCPCALSDLSKYNEADKQEILSNFDGTGGTDLQVQKCSSFQESIKDVPGIQTYVSFLSNLEDYLDCTGWCVPFYAADNLFYKFSNVQNGKPSGYCYAQLKKWILNWSRVMEYTCFATAGALLLVTVFNLCICFHPGRRNKRMRQRFSHQENEIGYHRQN